MKHPILLSLLLACSLAQAQLVQNIYFVNAVQVPCPADSSVLIKGYNDWSIYQTLNDEWDGEKDSNICISVIQIPQYGCKIPLNQIDSERRLFIVSKFNTLPSSSLNPHIVYNLPLSVEVIGTFNIEVGLDSVNHPLSYEIARTEIPDSSFTGTTFRLQKVGLNYVDSSWINLGYTYNTCLASEKFDQQNLRQVIAGLKFTTTSNSDTLKLILFGSDGMNYPETYNEIIVPYFNGEYTTSIGSIFDPSLIVYDNTTYPSSQNIDAAIVTPLPNPDTAVHMTILNQSPSSLIFEPYTQLKAAEVNGQPGVYHTFTLINAGGEICANFIELVFNDGDEFLYQSGEINLNASPSCFRFKNGATLHIAEGSELNYGASNNSGILLLNDGSKLIIESGATLNIWNRVMLREDHPEDGPKQFYMSLEPGATLRFMPGSRLTNLYSADNTIKLNVFMNGGLLDDSGLSENDKQLINRIYDQQSLVDGVSVFPNPASDHVSIISQKNISEIQLLNVCGQLLSSQDYLTTNQISVSGFAAGIYFLRLKTDEGIITRKIEIL